MSDLAPGLLIAVPQLDDPNFARSVVLLIEHNESGAMGVVFNRPSEIGLRDIGKEHGMEGLDYYLEDISVVVGGLE